MTATQEEPWRPARWKGRSGWALWHSMLLKDHCLVRWVVPNRHRVTPEAWRSGQPMPWDLALFKRRGGRSVVNLRGETKFGTYVVTRRKAEALGLAFHDHALRSRDVPHREELVGLLDLFERIAYPALFYCKSGADRSGLVSALYLIAREKRPTAQARKALGLRYLHFRHAKAGILGSLLEDFARWEAATGGDLRRYAEEAYEPDRLRAARRPFTWRGFLAEALLRRE